MSTTHTPVAPADHSVDTALPRPPAALTVRRWFLVASPVLAGLLAVVGAYADPAPGLSGEQLYAAYAAHPGPLQVKSLAFHWSYAFWIAPALLVAPYVRSRAAWWANVTAAVGFAGMTTLPGLLFVDWYDSAIGSELGVTGTVAVSERLDTLWAVPVFTLPGVAGLLLALPLTALTLWRAGLVRWWALVSVLAGFAAFALSGVTWWGCAVTTVFFTAFAVALARATRPAPA